MNAPIDIPAPRGLLTVRLADLDTASEFQQRRTQASADADRGLAESIAAMGILTPILVRWNEATQQHQVVDGHRRVAAAIAAGHIEVPAVEIASDERTSLAAGVAANTQRAPLAPVDLWRAIVHLQAHGWTLDGAAGALGIAKRLAKQLDKLGRLHPDMLGAIAAHDMPEEDELAMIAGAPPAVQEAALKNGDNWDDDYDRQEGTGTIRKVPNWYGIARACDVHRIPQSRAIFDVTVIDLQWDEDLFAQPDDADRFTTLDIPGFITAQTAALVAKTKHGKLRAVEWDPKAKEPRLPAGWKRTWDPKAVGAVRFAAVNPEGYSTGCIVEIHAVPPPEPASRKGAEAEAPRKELPAVSGDPRGDDDDAPADLDGEGEPEEDDDTPLPAAAVSEPPPAKPGRGPLTEKGRILVAEAKTTAIRCALRDRRDHRPEQLLAVLVLAIAGDNVSVRGDPARAHSVASFHDLTARLVGEDGAPCWQPGEVLSIAAEAAARMIVCAPTAQSGNTSGAAAEWIGIALEAHRDMPRLDTAEILATVNGETLKAADITNDGTGKGTSKAIRERLTGNAEGLALPGSAFAAPGRKHRPTADGFTPCLDCDDPDDCKTARKCWATTEENEGDE